MKLSQTRKLRTATIDLGEGESFTFEYYSFSPNEWDRIDAESKSEEWQIVMQLKKLLKTTGLEDDDGQPIPPTDEGLRQVEMPVLKAMLSAIITTTLPKKAT